MCMSFVRLICGYSDGSTKRIVSSPFLAISWIELMVTNCTTVTGKKFGGLEKR